MVTPIYKQYTACEAKLVSSIYNKQNISFFPIPEIPHLLKRETLKKFNAIYIHRDSCQAELQGRGVLDMLYLQIYPCGGAFYSILIADRTYHWTILGRVIDRLM